MKSPLASSPYKHARTKKDLALFRNMLNREANSCLCIPSVEGKRKEKSYAFKKLMKNLNWGAILRSIMNKIYEKIANLRTEINFFKKNLKTKFIHTVL